MDVVEQMATPSLTAIPAKATQTAYHLLDGEAVVLDIPGKIIRGLNPVASRVWQLVDGQRSLGEIAAMIAKEFAAEQAVVVQDVTVFVSELADKKLLTF
jgi:coenzyme PQQ biosynthesis protein PqqD